MGFYFLESLNIWFNYLGPYPGFVIIGTHAAEGQAICAIPLDGVRESEFQWIYNCRKLDPDRGNVRAL